MEVATIERAYVKVIGLAQTALRNHALLVVPRKVSVATEHVLVSLDGPGHHVRR